MGNRIAVESAKVGVPLSQPIDVVRMFEFHRLQHECDQPKHPMSIVGTIMQRSHAWTNSDI